MSNSILLPTAYLAPISYYALLTQYQDCNIEYHEHFIKQSIRNRCEVSGRPHGVYRKLKISRIALRDMASAGKIPGITKSSW